MGLVVALLSLASVASAAHSVAGSTPPGWVQHVEQVPHSHDVAFTICLKQQNIDELQRAALSVSTPGHPRYGRFLSVDEIDKMTAPSQSDFDAVTTWLRTHEVSTFTQERECLRVATTAGRASHLLKTSFGMYRREADGRLNVRASTYELPSHVAPSIDAIFGLHGVPLPPKARLPNPADPADVTPTVLAQTYHVGAPYVDRHGTKNKQAVAEFQGQYMNKSDLSVFFSKEVPSAQPGDDHVSDFVGVPYKEGNGVEALLDIQFIMGVAPGVKTEFWEWPDMAFCDDLLNYTSMLLKPGGPIVNSISYGWQGDLGKVGCHPAEVAKVDANWAKLAAAGVSVFISSGDSGSQCTSSACEPASWAIGKKVTGGEVLKSYNEQRDDCCMVASDQKATFTWTPPPGRETPSLRDTARAAALSRTVEEGQHASTKPVKPLDFDDEMYHVFFSVSTTDAFPARDVHVLNGKLGAGAGDIKVHNTNGTFPDTTIHFTAPLSKHPDDFFYRNVSMSVVVGGKTETFTGHATFFTKPLYKCLSIIFEKIEGDVRHAIASLELGPNPPPPPPQGNCTLYKSISGVEPAADNRTVSGGPGFTNASVVLYPSWPASSPWVTAVGATRFLNQTVGHEEMATDQFGSGGGFSSQWSQSQAPWQQAAVAQYVAQGPSLPKWPPSGSFPPLGRATPDVSALGEGYQVIVGGKAESVGGTSASSPAFAGYVSLINEARFRAGKPQMGFINPFLYANPHAFTDIVKGTNAIGRGTGDLQYGFAAAPGWDAATGLGTPLFDKLLEAALAA